MENMELKQLRDSILAFMMAKDCKISEIKTVLQMCNDEVDAWEKRGKIVELNKEEE